MAHIFVTGCRGIVGSILMRHLGRQHTVAGVDLPDDLTTLDDLPRRVAGADAVIHLARERLEPTAEDPEVLRLASGNVAIDAAVFSAVVAAGIPRLILAGSIHADDFRGPRAPRKMTTPGSYRPATPYGTYKLLQEEVGKVLAAAHGFEVVGIRLGGVSADDSVKCGPGRSATWLSHDDLGRACSAVLDSAPVPGRAVIFYAVSANAGSLHDTSNPFGWQPRGGTAAQAE